MIGWKIILLIGAFVWFLVTNPAVVGALLLLFVLLGVIWINSHIFGGFFGDDD